MNARHEEAAQIAIELVSSLENLPEETQYLLEGIKHLDVKSEELSAKIATETKEYLQRSRGNAGRARPPRDAAPAAVARMYDELDALAAEKVDLSARLVQKFERVMARLQNDMQRVLELEGDEPGSLPPTREFLQNLESTVQQISSLRAVAAQEMGIGSLAPLPPAAASTTSAPPAQKKRKATPSADAGKASRSVPIVGGGRRTKQTPGPSRARGHSPQVAVRSRRTTRQTKRQHTASDEDQDETDKETEKAGDEAEDNTLYCYCEDVSWGEMIECENPGCPKVWFHLSCTGLTRPFPEEWYCDDCSQILGIPRTRAPAASGRGGRKGQKKL